MILEVSQKSIIDSLCNIISKKLLNELLGEYNTAKRSHFLEDWEKSVLHASKFAEVSLAVVKNIVDKEVIDINDIYFDRLCNDFANRTKISCEDDILMLAIPRTARSIYSIRNKKRVAHVKAIDPDSLDSKFCASACDWILSQFVMLFMHSDPIEVSSLLHSLIEKQVPFVEQFEDGSLFVLKEGLTFRNRFLVALYKLGRRISRKELTRILKTYHQLVNSTSKNLEENMFTHANENGVILTKKGIKYVEEKLLA